MIRRNKGKIMSRGIIFVILSFFLVSYFKSHKNEKFFSPIDLKDAIHNSCFSPNNDKIMDQMVLNAHFNGKPDQKVYVFLFIKKNDQFICFHHGSDTFSQSGEAAILLSGKKG